ncbi:DUF2292 domain-containing protein [Robertmurraya korlensis]|uniref:DUF2292 domain-containing protein n=1 Tax=Robertmurraya korlensis TaxID=519977 RepID=UPI00082562D6|nr:DUF2292 domain-containing protein [Robertmurraya korlensis]
MLSKGQIDEQVIEKDKVLLESLEYGTVQITVHNSQVTKVDTIEKHRLPLLAKGKTQQKHAKKQK